LQTNILCLAAAGLTEE